ncbi:MAG: hypothetical protein PF569_00010 [Candidatus Woesearchaeota archaeon]|nr:hypothetical protein [Candidatus Woesearchaeota archaeon]
MVYEQTQVKEVSEVFRKMYDVEEQIAERKEAIKDLNGAIKDAKKTLAEKLEIDAKSVDRAYKTWIFEQTNAGVYDESETLLEAVKDELKKLSLED